MLYYFVPINDDGSINLDTPSSLFPLNRRISKNYVLEKVPFSGQYNVFAYDIENDGALRSGINYPAGCHENLVINQGNAGGGIIMY